jgi:hypothetical protein
MAQLTIGLDHWPACDHCDARYAVQDWPGAKLCRSGRYQRAQSTVQDGRIVAIWTDGGGPSSLLACHRLAISVLPWADVGKVVASRQEARDSDRPSQGPELTALALAGAQGHSGRGGWFSALLGQAVRWWPGWPRGVRGSWWYVVRRGAAVPVERCKRCDGRPYSMQVLIVYESIVLYTVRRPRNVRLWINPEEILLGEKVGAGGCGGVSEEQEKVDIGEVSVGTELSTEAQNFMEDE